MTFPETLETQARSRRERTKKGRGGGGNGTLICPQELGGWAKSCGQRGWAQVISLFLEGS